MKSWIFSLVMLGGALIPFSANAADGQVNTGLVLGGAPSKTYYEKYTYYVCGRPYIGYRAAQVANTEYKDINPIGAVNTDNSVTHTYTYNITYGQLPVNQGSTVYGYSSVADVYGNTDIGQLYNLAIRLAGDQNALADKATANAMSLVAQAGRERTKVAEILAKGQVIAQSKAGDAALAAALSSPGSVDSSSSKVEFKSEVKAGDGKTIIDGKPMNVNSAQSVQAIFNNKCVSCHKSGKEKGGLNLEDASKLDSTQVENILDRIVNKNPSKRMPQSVDGPGESLSLEEIAVLFKAATN